MACTYDILGIISVERTSKVPHDLKKASAAEQLLFLERVGKKVVEQVALVDQAFLDDEGGNEEEMVADETVYNYAHVLVTMASQ